MTEPTNHTVIIHTHFGHDITAPVIFVRDLGEKRALVHLETDFHFEENRDHRATYSTGSKKAEGKYRLSAKVFTTVPTYIYMGVFERAT